METKATQKYILELTRKELEAIHHWMCYADNLGDSPFQSEDSDIRALVNKIIEVYNANNL